MTRTTLDWSRDPSHQSTLPKGAWLMNITESAKVCAEQEGATWQETCSGCPLEDVGAGCFSIEVGGKWAVRRDLARLIAAQAAVVEAAREGCRSCEETAGECAALMCPHRPTRDAIDALGGSDE